MRTMNKPASRDVAGAGTRLDSVQILRAIAVTMVATYHALAILPDPQGARAAVPAPFYVGYAGVDLFFVISGFIIMHATAGVVDVRTFLAKRLARILPAYWAVTLLVFLAWLARPALVPLRGDGVGRLLLQSLLLIPEPYRPLLGVGWTLQHELIFYALIAGLIAAGARRHALAATMALFAAGLVVHILVPGLITWDYRLLSLFWLEFGLGILAYHLAGRPIGGPGLAAAGIALMLLTAWRLKPLLPPDLEVPTIAGGDLGLIRVAGFGCGSLLLLLGALRLERRVRLCGRCAAAAVSVGDASFVIYLTHNLVLGVAAAAAHRAHLGVAASAVIALGALVGAGAGGVLLSRLIEEPLHGLGRIIFGLNGSGRPAGRSTRGPRGGLQPDPA